MDGDSTQDTQPAIPTGTTSSANAIINSQLKPVVLIQRLKSEKYVWAGDGLCIGEDGLIVTGHGVVKANGGSDTVTKLRVLMYGGGEFVEAQLVGSFPSLGIALLKMSPGQMDGGKFRCIDIGESVQVGWGEPVVAYGGSFGFSSSFGDVSYPYNTCTSHLDCLFANCDKTLMSMSLEEMDRDWMNGPNPPFRTVAECVSKEKRSKLGYLNPNLPLIQASGMAMASGSCGTPVFKKASVEVAGILCFGTKPYGFFVPVDVISRVVKQWKEKTSQGIVSAA